jgi:hypothetical protein
MRAAIALLLASATLQVQAQPTTCPPMLAKAAVAVKAPAGWQGYSSSLMRLTGFGMMAGPPESMTYLVPANSKKRKDGSVTIWQFAGGGEKWLYCTYDGSAAIQISRRLDDTSTRCEVSAKTAGGVVQAAEAVCR